MPTIDTTDSQLSERLKELQGQIEARSVEQKKLDDVVAEAKSTYAKKGYSAGSPEFEETEAAMRAAGGYADETAEMEAEEKHVLKMLAGRGGRAQKRQLEQDRPEYGAAVWEAERILADANLRESLYKIYKSPKNKFGSLELGEVYSRDALLADITVTAAMRRGDYAGVLPQLRRRLTILDLIPTGTMDGESFYYTRESGSLDGAAEQTEGSAKAEGTATFTDDEAKAETIAVWNKIRKQALADYRALQTALGDRLRYQVLRRLEKQIVSGDGSGDNLLGIRNTTGIGTTAFVANTLKADQILKGHTAVILADGTPTATLAHPLAWQDMVVAKAAGDGHYYSGGPFESTPQVVWGQPLIPTVAVPQNTATVGDFEIGVQLLIREGVNLLISDNDADDFTKNRVTLLAEMRAALPVWRPSLFNDVALA